MGKSIGIYPLVGALLSAGTSVLAQDAHGAINPSIDFSGTVDQGLLNALSPTQSFWDQWGAGWIPQDCKSNAESNGVSPSDMEVYNVYYTDCDQAWVMCRHKDSRKSLIDLIDLFGRMPLQMREFITHPILIPDFPSEGLAAYTVSTGPVVFDSDGLRQYIMVHELSHQLDWHGRADISSGQFSNTGDWQDNYNQDSAVVSEYARSSWAENFAETGIIGVYDKLVEGGFGAIQSNWNDVFHQYATYQGYMQDYIIPGERQSCTSRRSNSETVPMAASASRILGTKPDTSIKPGIKIIQSGTNETLVCTGR